LTPRARVDIIDVNPRAGERAGWLSAFPKALYCSFHTTAGYLEAGLAARLTRSDVRIKPYLQIFRTLFPEAAGYRHDEMHLRGDLTDDERLVEPHNGDAHLAFIAAGLQSCVKYTNRPQAPVYFIDLDGVVGKEPRRRTTSILAFNSEEVVYRRRVQVPVSSHALESVSLKQPAFGLYDELREEIAREGITKGRIHISLAPGEHEVGLTVNEYETLLMRHDLADALRDPFRFVAEQGRDLLAEPRAIARKTLDHSKYDLVRVFNKTFDALDMKESLIEKMLARLIAIPARRFLRMKRSVSLLISDRRTPGRGEIAEGRYQCPILVQWRKAEHRQRALDVTVTRLR
jgi:thiamine phosphate synthase YjbQ (UPF0047 family)